MNYRHAFHAGNFADVVKHAILVRILVHLRAKPTPFRVIDTHAGAGLYDLASSEASRSGEWHEGIARLMGAPIAEEAKALLAPYLAAISALNQPGDLIVYPGSPMLARAFLRERDRLVACELEPSAAAALAANLRKDRRCKAIAIDGWTALNAYIPPKERRGLVLIDPSFEDTADFRRLEHALDAAHRKWATGIYLLWYPIKDRRYADILAHGLRRSGIANSLRPKILRAKILRAEILRAEILRAEILRAEINLAGTRDRLRACGLIVVNPPWRLESELKVLLPALVTALTQDNGGAHRVDWLNGEK